jgi:hypothetical protein
MTFYDVTPLGHILSYFAKHLYSVDEVLPDALLQVVSVWPIFIGALALSCVFVPWLWATLPVFFVSWTMISRLCLIAQDSFSQLESHIFLT